MRIMFFLTVFTLLKLQLASAAPVMIERVEAAVGPTLILYSDVTRFRSLLGLRSQLDPLFQGTALSQKGERAPDKEIVDFLVNEAMITQLFKVADAEVEQEINSIQANNKISRATLKQTLKDQGYSFEDYFELIRVSSAKRNLIDREIRTKVSIADDDLKNYFYNHYARSSEASNTYFVKMITVTVKNFRSASAAKEVANRALSRIHAGEMFEEVAKSVSDDATASSGGDLGALSSDQMSPAIRNQLRLMKIGDVSPVLGSADSKFFILKLTQITTADDERFEKMRDEIYSKLASQEYQHQIQLWIDRQRVNSFIHFAGEDSTVGIPK